MPSRNYALEKIFKALSVYNQALFQTLKFPINILVQKKKVNGLFSFTYYSILLMLTVL